MSAGNALQIREVTFGKDRNVSRFLAAGASVTLAAWVLGLLVSHIGAPATGERSVDLYLAQHRSAGLSQIAMVINVLLGVSVAPIVLVTISLLAAKIWNWLVGVLIFVVTGASWVAAAFGKMLVHRSRPPGAVLGALVSETGADSYPSGHTAFAAGLLASAVVISYIYGRSPLATGVLGLPAVIVVGVSRLYLGVHYVADVIGSGLVAAASTLILLGLYNAVSRHLALRSHSALSPRTAEDPADLSKVGAQTATIGPDTRGEGDARYPEVAGLPYQRPIHEPVDMMEGPDAGPRR